MPACDVWRMKEFVRCAANETRKEVTSQRNFPTPTDTKKFRDHIWRLWHSKQLSHCRSPYVLINTVLLKQGCSTIHGDFAPKNTTPKLRKILYSKPTEHVMQCDFQRMPVIQLILRVITAVITMVMGWWQRKRW